MPIKEFSLTQPGVFVSEQLTFPFVFVDGTCAYKPGGGVINGTKTRDVLNTSYQKTIRAGLTMSYNTTNKDYANWQIGVSTGAIAGTGTTLSASAATVTELVRRVGASGTFTLTGPPAASGVARQSTVTYSAASGTSITVTALGTNQADKVQFNIASTGGNVQLTVQKPDGTFVTTASAAWSATDATYLASINSALDTATGVVGGIVATAISAVDTDLGFILTYAGTGYAGLPWTKSQVALLPTSSTLSTVFISTVAVNGAFAAGSVVSEVGYDIPNTIVKEPPAPINETGSNVDWPRIPMAGDVLVSAIIDYPTDSGLKTWYKDHMSTLSGPKFIFSDAAF